MIATPGAPQVREGEMRPQVLVTSSSLSASLFLGFTRHTAAHDPILFLLSPLLSLWLWPCHGCSAPAVLMWHWQPQRVAIETVAREEGCCGQMELLLRQGVKQTSQTASFRTHSLLWWPAVEKLCGSTGLTRGSEVLYPIPEAMKKGEEN